MVRRPLRAASPAPTQLTPVFVAQPFLAVRSKQFRTACASAELVALSVEEFEVAKERCLRFDLGAIADYDDLHVG